MERSRKFSLTVYGRPIGQPRARFTVAGGGHARMYTPKHPVSDYKAGIRQEAGPLFDSPLEGAIVLRVECVFPRNKNQIWKRRPMLTVPHTVKPDVDNISKAVMDALKGIAWRDDAQVCDLRVVKRVAAGDELPRTDIVLWMTASDLEAGDPAPCGAAPGF